MTYPGSHLLITWLFEVIGTEEIAATSVKCTNVADPYGFIAADAQAAVDDTVMSNLVAAMDTLLSSSAFLWGNYSRITGMKVASIGPTGKYVAEAAVGDAVAGLTGGSSVPSPFESVVLTLDSGTRLGRAQTGRMYLPHCRNATSTTGNPYMQGVTGMLTAATTFWTTIKAEIGALPGAPEPCILSSLDAGTAKSVLLLSMDNILDVQRRRKNRLVSTRTFANLP